MSNDGNKSTKRVPFTMFSSSADGGYLTDFHTNFTGGVEINNIHTDTYGDFRNPPMQGPFTEAMVGGEQHRHTPLNTGTDYPHTRAESFLIEFPGASSIEIKKAQGELPGAELILDDSSIGTTPRGSAIDTTAGKIYWTDNNLTAIKRANLDGTDVETLYSFSSVDPNTPGNPRNIALDVSAGVLYYTDEFRDAIYSAHMDGSGFIAAVATGLTNPYGLDLDVLAGKLYYTHRPSDSEVRRVNTDGTNDELVVGSISGQARELHLDLVTPGLPFHRIYWAVHDTFSGPDTIQRCSKFAPAGTPETIISEPDDGATDSNIISFSLDKDNQKIYWWNRTAGFLKRANTDGSDIFEYSNVPLASSNSTVAFNTDSSSGRDYLYWIASNEFQRVDTRTFVPFASYYRDEFAKRPLNIRNIKVASPGNYSQEYEVIQIAGRTLNPRHFAENPDQYTTDFAQNFGTEGRVLNTIDADGNIATGSLQDYTLPDNAGSTNNFIFVNKFSAPGDRYTMSRGFLNPKGEEFSVYNASPFRNLNVREENSENLTAHNEQFTAPYHLENRNTKFLQTNPSEELRVLVPAGSTDNAVDVAYDGESKKIYWCDSLGNNIGRCNSDGSNVETVISLPGKVISSIDLDVPNQKIYWVNSTDGSLQRADMEVGATPEVLQSGYLANTLLNVRLDLKSRKVYWTQLIPGNVFRADMEVAATVENIYTGLTLTSALAIDSENNRLFVPDSATDLLVGSLDGSTTLRRIGPDFGGQFNFRYEPVFKRLYAGSFATNSEIGYFDTVRGTEWQVILDSADGLVDPSGVAVDSETQRMYFADDNTDIIGTTRLFRVQYDNGNFAHALPQSSLQYSWIKKSALTDRSEVNGYATGSDIPFYSGTIGFESPMNNIYIDEGSNEQDFDFTGSVYGYNTWKQIRGGETRLSRYFRENNILPVADSKDNVAQYIEPPVVSKNKPLEYIMAIDSTGAPYSIKSAYGSVLQRYSNKEINKLFNTDVSDSNTEYAKMKPLYLEKSVTDPNNPVKQFYSLNYEETVFPKSKNTYMNKVRVRGNYTEVAGTGQRGYDRLYGTQNTFYSSTAKRTDGAENSQGTADVALAFDPMRSDGSDSFPRSGYLSSLNVGELNFNSDNSLTSSLRATASLAYSEANFIQVGSTGITLTDYTERLVEEMSGKKRWYDSYSDYEENIRGLLKDASILPEFRVSEHMDYYVDDSAGNFRAENKKFLTLLGAEYSSSADSRTSNTFDVNFEDTYLDTENIKNLEKIRQDHTGYASPKKLTIKASGVKKLLPYNGFYPDTRTVQLGNLLSQSLGDNVSGFLFDPTSPSKAEAYLSSSSTHGYAAILKPLASPGILYNSTKAGLAVDYPIYSTTPDLKTYSKNPTNQAVITSSSQPDKRLPFETLVNFNENLPKDEKIFLVATSHSGSTLSGSKNYYGKWNGIKKPNFEIATHNYLAESVNFFLEGGQLNTFTSKPQLQFAEVEANKNYYMDVVLRDEAKMNRFVEYHNMSSSFPTYEVVDQQLGLSSVSGSELATSTAVAASGAYGAYVLFGIPTENKAVLAHVDRYGFTRDISVDSSGNPILTGSWNSDANYGESVAIVSGSDGNVHFVVGAPAEVRASNFTGSVSHYYASTTPSASVITYVTSSIGGTAGTKNFGTDVDITAGVDGFVHYTACGHIAGGNVSVRAGLWSAGGGTSISGISVPEMSSSQGINRVAIASGSTDVYIGLTSTHVSGAASSGLTILQSDQSSGGTITESAHEDLGSDDARSISAASPARFAGPNTSTYADNCFFTVGQSDDNFVASQKIYRHNPAVSTAYRLYSTAQVNAFNAGSTTGFGAFNGSVIYDGSSYSYDLAIAAPFRASEDIPYSQQTETGQPKQVALMKFDLPNVSTSTGNATMKSVEYLDPKPGEFADTPFSFGQGVAIDKNGAGQPIISCGQPLYDNSVGNVHLLYSAPRANRYSQNGKLFGVPTEGLYDPAYCAYTPPGFYGESVATIAFSSSIGGEVSLDEIIRTSRVTETQTAKEGSTSTLGGEITPLNAAQQQVKMNVASSVTLFAKSEQPDLQFEIGEDGEAVRVDRATTGGANNIRWAISTKYETPVIDVSSSAYGDNYASHYAGAEGNAAWGILPASTPRGYSLPRSSWTSYGQQTSPEKGYYFDLRESTSKTSTDGSLIELCGFTPGTKKVGSVAENKVITEAIMVIPYTEKAISRKTTEIEEGKHFFRVNMAELNRQNKSLDNNGVAVSKEIPETSIADMINGMKDYVIPPQYNFMKYKDIKPFAAYFLEFTHTLSQRDLIDIWQGVTPSIALNPETEDVEISHNFDKHNLFHNIDIPADMKFMVFKVKKKANWNYYTITADSADDDRFKFDFQGDGQVEVIPDYNYNWPYDFFTLVERAKVDVTVSLEKDEEETE